MKDTFAAWAALGALLHRAGNYAVVDRIALYDGEQMPFEPGRFQVIDHDQTYCRAFGLLDVAVKHAEDLFDQDLFALQTRVLENARYLEDESVSSLGIACHISV